MSQHVLRTTAGNGDAVTVTLGYDRPLNYVFCLVEDQRGDYPYSNLADLHAGTHQQDVEYFRRILAKLGIEVPEQMFAEVEADRANRVGNRTVDHTKSTAASLSSFDRIIPSVADPTCLHNPSHKLITNC